MPAYNPPVAHYTEVDATDLSVTQFLRAIGKEGIHFKKLTSRTGAEYIWWDQDRNVIEIWGSYGSLAAGAARKVRKYLDKIKTIDALQEEVSL
jgi:hypothetical protein